MSEPLVLTHALTKVYRGGVRAVDGIDLEVRRGDIYGFLGANGSGKTTTIRMLLGLVLPTSGEVSLLGSPMPRGAGEALRGVGALVEGPGAYPHLSGRANLGVLDAAGRGGLGRAARRRRTDEVLEQVGLDPRDRRPVRTYSLGMRQRLGLAAALNALPTLVAVLLAITDLGPRPGTGPPFLSAVLTDGTLFPLAALGLVLPLFLPVAVAVVGGDAIAGESQAGTLRYLLVRPVPRARLLLAKLVSVVAFVVLAVLAVALVGYVLGVLLLGDAPVTGVVSVSGSTLTPEQMYQRIAMTFVYVVLCMLGVAAIAIFFSTLTDSAVGAALGTIGLLVASTVLLGLDAADPLEPYLMTRHWLAFVDLFRDPIRWGDVVDGTLTQLAYLVVFAGAAWANFATKDIDR